MAFDLGETARKYPVATYGVLGGGALALLAFFFKRGSGKQTLAPFLGAQPSAVTSYIYSSGTTPYVPPPIGGIGHPGPLPGAECLPGYHREAEGCVPDTVPPPSGDGCGPGYHRDPRCRVPSMLRLPGSPCPCIPDTPPNCGCLPGQEPCPGEQCPNPTAPDYGPNRDYVMLTNGLRSMRIGY